jgi:hypothetical protein
MLFFFLIPCGDQGKQAFLPRKLWNIQTPHNIFSVVFWTCLQSDKFDEVIQLNDGSYETMDDQKLSVATHNQSGLMQNTYTPHGMPCLREEDIRWGTFI